uniref:FERM domain-containing protein n=1 Tax=Parastrongyloides trichosuri TaxID=131310 RepID=A0A0N4Z8T5_PARTI
MSFLFDGLRVNQFNTQNSDNIKNEAILKIIFQDGSTQNMRFNVNVNGEKLRTLVMRHLGLLDNDYFGLMYEVKPGSNKWMWLNNKKKVNKLLIKDSSVLSVKFRVRFYPHVPHLVAEWLGRRILFMDIAENIKEGRWNVESKATFIELIALTCKILDPVLIRNSSVDGIIKNSEKYGKTLMEKFNILHCDILDVAMDFDNLLQRSNKRKRCGTVLHTTQNTNKDVLISEYLKIVTKLQWYGSIRCNINNTGSDDRRHIYANYKGLSFVNSSQELLVYAQWSKIKKIERTDNTIKISFNEDNNVTKITFERDDCEAKNYFYSLTCLKAYIEAWNKKVKDDEMVFLKKLSETSSAPTFGYKNNNISRRLSLGNSFRNSIKDGFSNICRRLSINLKTPTQINPDSFNMTTYQNQTIQMNDVSLTEDDYHVSRKTSKSDVLEDVCNIKNSLLSPSKFNIEIDKKNMVTM